MGVGECLLAPSGTGQGGVGDSRAWGAQGGRGGGDTRIGTVHRFLWPRARLCSERDGDGASLGMERGHSSPGWGSPLLGQSLGWLGLQHCGRRGGCLGLCCACLCYCMVSYFLVVNKSGLETAQGISGCSTLLFLLPGALCSCRVPEGWRGTLSTAYPLVRDSPWCSAAIP